MFFRSPAWRILRELRLLALPNWVRVFLFLSQQIIGTSNISKGLLLLSELLSHGLESSSLLSLLRLECLILLHITRAKLDAYLHLRSLFLLGLLKRLLLATYDSEGREESYLPFQPLLCLFFGLFKRL